MKSANRSLLMGGIYGVDVRKTYICSTGAAPPLNLVRYMKTAMEHQIEQIHWHDCVIESVVEIPSKDILAFNVLYPENWEQNIFVPKTIVFNGYFSQTVDGIPFAGNPTILDVSIVAEADGLDQNGGYFKVHIKTNADDRFITAKSVELIDEQCQLHWSAR